MYQGQLDERAKWEFVLEIERYQRQLRHIEATPRDARCELFREACLEHIDRVTGIYQKMGARQRTEEPAAESVPWAVGCANESVMSLTGPVPAGPVPRPGVSWPRRPGRPRGGRP